MDSVEYLDDIEEFIVYNNLDYKEYLKKINREDLLSYFLIDPNIFE